MVVQMIGVGEATGAMDTMLNKIADFYDDEVDTAVGGPHGDDRTADDGVPRRRGRRLPHRDVPADLLHRRCHQVAQRDGARRRAAPLRARLVWLTAFRTVATSLSLVAVAARLLSGPGRAHAGEDLLRCASGSSTSSPWSTALLLRARRGLRSAVVQVAGDVVIASVLVFLTGGPRAPSPSPTAGRHRRAHPAGQWGALVAAAACSASFLCSLLRSRGDIWTPAPGRPLGAGCVPLRQQRAGLVPHRRAGRLPGPAAVGHRRRGSPRASADLRELDTPSAADLGRMPSGLITCDAAGRVTYVNRAARRSSGWSRGRRPAAWSRCCPGSGRRTGAAALGDDGHDAGRAAHARADGLAAGGPEPAQLAHRLPGPHRAAPHRGGPAARGPAGRRWARSPPSWRTRSATRWPPCAARPAARRPGRTRTRAAGGHPPPGVGSARQAGGRLPALRPPAAAGAADLELEVLVPADDGHAAPRTRSRWGVEIESILEPLQARRWTRISSGRCSSISCAMPCGGGEGRTGARRP